MDIFDSDSWSKRRLSGGLKMQCAQDRTKKVCEKQKERDIYMRESRVSESQSHRKIQQSQRSDRSARGIVTRA